MDNVAVSLRRDEPAGWHAILSLRAPFQRTNRKQRACVLWCGLQNIGGQLYATISKRLFTLFKCKFDVDVPGPDDLLAEGDFLDHEYSFYRHGRIVASVSKKWFSWTDTYGIDIDEGESGVLILASAVVIDQACHDHKKRS